MTHGVFLLKVICISYYPHKITYTLISNPFLEWNMLTPHTNYSVEVNDIV